MKLLEKIKGRLLLVLILGILILCAGFAVISCGNAVLKVLDHDKGQFAIDFSDCSGGTFCRVLVPISDGTAAKLPIDGRPLTAEAWVKVNSTSTSGTITGRIGAEGGLALFVKNNTPKFLIKALVPPATTGTEFIVTSNVDLIKDKWTHIAGVLSNTVHTHPSSTSCALNVGNQTPHLDIYVNGVLTGCKTTGSRFASSPGIQSAAIGVNGDSGVTIDSTITDSMPFDGSIDEVRVYGVERTVDQINACMNTELGLSGNCSFVNTGLVGYARLNEGQGASTGDRAGLGSGLKGIKIGSDPVGTWPEGWTLDAAPITKVD